MALDWRSTIRLAGYIKCKSADPVCLADRGNEEQEHVGGSEMGTQRPGRASHWYMRTHVRVSWRRQED